MGEIADCVGIWVVPMRAFKQRIHFLEMPHPDALFLTL
jgi:hypothetical protein